MENKIYIQDLEKYDIEQYLSMDVDELNEYLRDACFDNDMPLVKFFLTSPLLKKNADIHYGNDWSLYRACDANNIEIVEYLLTSLELKEHANPNNQNMYEFLAKNYQRIDLNIINTLIFSGNMEYNEEFKNTIKNIPELVQIFEARTLNEKLNKNLQQKINVNKQKI